MDKHNKIFIKIQLEKNEETGKLLLKTRFDPEAPNFFQDKNEISWCPTHEEIQFIDEAFELMPQNKEATHGQQNKTETNEPLDYEKNETSGVKPKDDFLKNIEKTPKPEPMPSKKGEADGVIITADASAVDEIIRKRKNGE